MYQGESFPLIFRLKKSGAPVTPEMISNIKIFIGPLKKSYSAEEISYSGTPGRWIFPLAQADTIALPLGSLPCQIWYYFANGDVRAAEIKGGINVRKAISEGVLPDEPEQI